jgi:hypothetical protein
MSETELNPAQKLPPDLRVFGNDLKADIFATLNCCQIGKIEKVTPAAQTVEISLQIKRAAVDGTSTAYPVLVDCPYFVLQGGGAYIDMPITVGDYCIVLFCDRNIDTWWSTANVSDPATPRKHSLSDGIALVGLNPKTVPREMDGKKARLVSDENINIESEKQIELKSTAETKVTASKVELNGNSKAFVTHDELTTALNIFLLALNAHVHTSAAPGSPTTSPVTPMTLDISLAATTTIKTGG